MAFTIHHLIITLIITVLCCVLSASAAPQKTPLAIQVCKNTTDFNLCRDILYIDHRAPTADRVILASIAFPYAYFNATNIRAAILYNIEKFVHGGGSESSDLFKSWNHCVDYYTETIRSLSEVLRELILKQKYHDFVKPALQAENRARACEKGFNGTAWPLARQNSDFIKIANICYVVAKLYAAN